MFLSVETKEAKQAILSMGKVQQTVIYEVPIPGKSGKVGIAAIWPMENLSYYFFQPLIEVI